MSGFIRGILGALALLFASYGLGAATVPGCVAPTGNVNWPVTGLAGPFAITGTMGEYRRTGANPPRFHSGVDVRRSCGQQPADVVATRRVVSQFHGRARHRIFGSVDDGIVIVDATDTILAEYNHITTDRIADNSPVIPGTYVGMVHCGVEYGPGITNHVHLKVPDQTVNALSLLNNYSNTDAPVVRSMHTYVDNSSNRFSIAAQPIFGKIDILVDAYSSQSQLNGSGVTAPYKVDYKVSYTNSLPPNNVVDIVPFTDSTSDSIVFESLGPATAGVPTIYNTQLSDRSNYFYWATNRYQGGIAEDRYWNTRKVNTPATPWNGPDAETSLTAQYPDGFYSITGRAIEIQCHFGERQQTVLVDNFRPFVRKVEIVGQQAGASHVFYSAERECAAPATLVTMNTTKNDTLTNTQPYVLLITFSERMDASSVTASIDSIGSVTLHPKNANNLEFSGTFVLTTQSPGPKQIRINGQDDNGTYPKNSLLPVGVGNTVFQAFLTRKTMSGATTPQNNADVVGVTGSFPSVPGTEDLAFSFNTGTLVSSPQTLNGTVDGFLNCAEAPAELGSKALILGPLTPGNWNLQITGGCISHGSNAQGRFWGLRLKVRLADNNLGNALGPEQFVGVGSFNSGVFYPSCSDAQADINVNNPLPLSLSQPITYVYVLTDDSVAGVCGDNIGSQTVSITSGPTTPITNPGGGLPPAEPDDPNSTVDGPGGNTFGNTGDDVIDFSGNFFLEFKDISVLRKSNDVSIHRYYNSQPNYVWQTQRALDSNGVMGDGWSHEFEAFLHFPDSSLGETFYIVFFGNGSQVIVNRSQDGQTFATNKSFGGTFTKEGSKYVLTSPNKEFWEFDEQGRFIRTGNRIGNTRTLVYGGDGRLSTVLDFKGNTLFSMEYHGDGKLSRIVESSGKATDYSYNIQGLLSSVGYGGGYSAQYAYDSHGHLNEIRDPKLQNDYRSFGVDYTLQPAMSGLPALWRAQRLKSQSGQTIYSFEYSSFETTIRDGSGNPTVERFNHRGQIVEKTDPLGNVEIFKYGSGGKLIERQDKRGNVQNFAYDTLGNPILMVDRKGETIEWEYDALHNLLTGLTNSRGAKNTFSYIDEKLVSAIDPLGSATSFQYNPDDLLASVQDARGGNYVYSYDANGNLIGQTDPLGRSLQLLRNSRGLLLGEVRADGLQIQLTYNSLDELERITLTDGTSIHFYHDANGLIERVVDRAGRQMLYARDERGRVVQSTDPSGAITAYEYDSNGNRTKVTDAKGNVRRFQYDSLGRLTKVIMPSGRQKEYGYDPNGNLKYEIDGNGVQLDFTYDQNDRPLSNGISTFTYDANGNTLMATNAHGSLAFTYDLADRVIKQVDNLGNEIHFVYDASGNVVEKEMLSGTQNFKLQYQYDLANQLTSLVTTNVAVNLAYDSLGRVTEESYSNGVKSVSSYHPLSRQLSVIRHFNRLDEIIAFYKYEYNVDRVSREESLLGNTWFEYDSRGQISKATYPDGRTEEFEYDSVGNIASISRDGNVSALQYSVDDELLQVGADAFTYDMNGSLVAYQGHSLAYDPRNLLATINGPTTQAFPITFQYDAFYRRNSVQNPSGSTMSVNDPFGIAFQRKGTDSYDFYITKGTSPFAAEQKIFAVSGNGGQFKHLVLYDGLERATVLLDREGEPVQTYQYNVYGSLQNVSQDSGNAHGFMGAKYAEMSFDTKLMLAGRRYYAPEIGRFISRDAWTFEADDERLLLQGGSLGMGRYESGQFEPLLFEDTNALRLRMRKGLIEVSSMLPPQAKNAYAFAWNNPISMKDPSGLSSDTAIGKPATAAQVIGTVIGAVVGFFLGIFAFAAVFSAAPLAGPTFQSFV